MNTLEDIAGLCDGPYGLRAVRGAFSGRGSTNFYGAQREWEGIRDTCDALIARHKLSPEARCLSIGETPVIHAFRQAYRDALLALPPTKEECVAAIDDMLVTLETVRTLDEVTPFERDDETTSFVVSRLKDGDIGKKHVQRAPLSVTDVAEHVAARWNKNRGKDRREMKAWDEKTYVQTVVGRSDIVVKRLYPDGNADQSVGYYILRDDSTPGTDQMELIDWGSVWEAGVPDALAAHMVLQLRNMTQKRIVNLVEKFH